ncbi:ATP-binding cassette subfamily C protein/ATP-binding cassette subfamily C protein CydD [Haloactinopolyspora alba]|uniref:ATP-binding cassette subfamily C protein/ATP-binding cassette subfamily C protein CydD n=2 Tax=Haloactinopolyspora alba TaxID=648780 RepID=A0A2P8EB60_9ACTN|nr:ATP-binding cassette subfamily C protein/ATP-binding cassette subfamily C protein CydD [Haloactinopolyspora alba]
MAAAGAALILVQADLLAGALADAVVDSPSPGELRPVLTALALVLAGRAGLAWCQQVASQRAAAAVKASLRRRVLHRTQELGPQWLSGQHTGRLATTLGRGMDALDPYFTGYFPQLFVAAVVPVAIIVQIAVADLASAVIICVTLPLIPVFGVLVGLQTKRSTRRQWSALERLGGQFLDLVAGLPTLRAFGRAQAQAAAVRRAADEHRSATMSTLRVAFLSALVLELVATLSVALVAVPVGLRLLDGELDLHTALLVLLLAPEAYLPWRALGSQFHASTEGLEVAERAFAVLDSPVVRPDDSSLRRLSPSVAEKHATDGSLTPASRPDARPDGSSSPAGDGVSVVRFEGVSVSYPGRNVPALDAVSFTIGAGEHVALVGPSGAGKTTVLSVLLGLVPPGAGRVLVTGADGAVDLAAAPPEAAVRGWRDGLAWVPQRPHLFADSVAANIRLGYPGATDEQVCHAARLAHADEFVTALPHGYDTVLGERGAGLSAGQRQRVALARAFLRDAPLLILDEPTAGLDATSEAKVVEATARLMAGRTVVVVAHRPAMVADADRVIRLEHGRVAADSAGGARTAVVAT